MRTIYLPKYGEITIDVDTHIIIDGHSVIIGKDGNGNVYVIGGYITYADDCLFEYGYMRIIELSTNGVKVDCNIFVSIH